MNSEVDQFGRSASNSDELNDDKSKRILDALSDIKNQLQNEEYIPKVEKENLSRPKETKKNINHDLHRYPEIDGSSLREAIAKNFSIDSNRIILGSGSDEVLLFAALAFCQDGDEILHANHGFEMYSIVSKVVGAVPKKIKEDVNFNLNIENLIDQTNDATKVIYIASPNNPTGTYLSRDQLVKLMNSISKNIIVVIDGAYVEYVQKDDYDKGFSLTDEYENIILTRTFSKTYGLAALRVGWCYTSQKIADIIIKIKPPFNTTTISQSLAIKALEDKEHIENSVKLNSEIKDWFEKELKLLNIKTRQTEGNFTLIETSEEEAEKISNNRMVGSSIKLLYGDNHKGYRIVGTEKKFIDLYKGVFEEGKEWEKPFEVIVGSKVHKNLKIIKNFLVEQL